MYKWALKSTFAQNVKFSTTPLPLLVPVRFTCPPSSMYVRFIELPPPLYFYFSNEKWGSEKREKT